MLTFNDLKYDTRITGLWNDEVVRVILAEKPDIIPPVVNLAYYRESNLIKVLQLL